MAEPRLRSLDIFRGLTIAGMILVNNAGDWGHTFAPLEHAKWHGWTLTDLVFPFFLFIVGVAIPFALGRRALGAGEEPASAREVTDRRALHRKIWRRAALLFALGLALIWFPYYTVSWERCRIFGVLQRIAIVYLSAALAYLHLGARARALLAALLLAGYWAVMMLVPVPGFSRGDLSAEGNVAAHLDHLILGSHIWRYAPGPGDPEGILSTVPAIVSALIGLFVGDWLRSAHPARRKISALILCGLGASVAGLFLDRWFPINKNLWSPPYVLLTAGLAMISLATLFAIVDIAKWQRWALPFTVFGTNSILAYVGSGVMARLFTVIRWVDASGNSITLQTWLYSHWFAPHLPPYWASLAWALAFVAVWLAMLSWLYRRRWFLRV
jgi:predicted acyltransferase